MKPLSVIAPVFGLSLLALHAFGQVPVITSISSEEYVSSIAMEHPDVAADSKGQPHMVADFGVGNSLMKFHRVKGRWDGGVFATGSRGGRYDASRLYIGQIEIDGKDRAWISCKMGVKEYGDMYGQGVWLFRDVDTNLRPTEQFFRFVSVYKGMGLVSTDAKYDDEGVVLGTFGNWEKLNASGQTLGRGSINAGHGGEKVRFRIASYAPRFGAVPGRAYADGIWHTAMNGSSALSSKYQNNQRYKAGLGPVTWAEHSAYPIQGDDYCHPGVGIDLDDPRVCYIGSVFEDGNLCINVWDGNRLLFNPFSLKVLDFDARWEGRAGVKFAPAIGGGAFVFWASGSVIKMAYLSQKGVSTTPVVVTAGRSPAAATDRYGNVHLVYHNGGIRYRKIQVSVLQGLSPKGRVENTRTPRFRWTSTKAASYTLEIRKDGGDWEAKTSSSNAWRPSASLAVGDYVWRVKEGKPGSAGNWTKALPFQIPPAVPAPGSPDGRYAYAPVRPTFRWTSSDPKANRHVVKLFSNGDLVDSIIVAGPATSLRWPANLGAGSYTWRVKAVRYLPEHSVDSDWSPDIDFQVAVPGSCRITDPQRLQTFDPGDQTVVCRWTSAEGAKSYNVKVLYNDSLLVRVDEHDRTRYQLVDTLKPGYYSVFVQPVNKHGKGAWSPGRTFIVTRYMNPGKDKTLSEPPRDFQWTRAKGATRYLVKLSVYDRDLKKYRILREVRISQPSSGAGPRWTPAITLPNGAYRWTVTDYAGTKPGYSSVAYFQIGVPGLPLLRSPSGAVAGQRLLPLVWTDPSVVAEEFQVQVWDGDDLVRELDWGAAEALQANAGVFSQTVWSFSDTGASYTWRVRGRNGKGSGPWKEGSFAVTPLDKPVLTEPAPGAGGAAGTAQPFIWGGVSNATHYEVVVYQGNDIVAVERLEGTNWLWTPAETGDYTIRLRAGETGWSRWASQPFTVY